MGTTSRLDSLGAPTVAVSAPDIVYSGLSYHAAASTLIGITGVPGYSLEGVSPVLTYYAGPTASGTPIAAPTNAGTYTVVASFPGSASYLPADSAPVTFQIAQGRRNGRRQSVQPHLRRLVARRHRRRGEGVMDESLSGLLLTGTVHTNAGTYADAWHFVDTTGNYNDASGTVVDSIAKADATIAVTPYSVVYDAATHTAAGSATGVLDEPLVGLILTGTSHTNAGTYADSWSFVDTTGNYNDASGTVGDAIARADATIDIRSYTVTYDAAAHTADGKARGVLNEGLGGLTLSGTSHTNAGNYADTWAFTDATGNYNNASGTVADTILKANAAIVVNPYSVTYDAATHTDTGTAKGVLNENLNGLVLTGTTHTNAGSYTDAWTFTDSTGNYNNASGASGDIIARANPSIAVNPYSVTYDAATHTASGSAKGVVNENLGGLVLTATTHTHAGNYTDAWTFTDVTGNYNNASGTVGDVIARANPTITVVPYNVLYDASAHTATGSARGVLNESLGGLVLTGTTHTNAGSYGSDPWTFTDATGNYNNASGTVADRIVRPASLSGYVYDDAGNDGSRTGDVGIAGVAVTLTGTNDLGTAVNLATTTNAGGLYQFGNLRPGTYALTETQPSGYLDGKDTIGTPGGATTNDRFSGVVLNEGVIGTENNFGEIAAVISGTVLVDATGNGLSSDDTGMAGVPVSVYVDANHDGVLDSGDGSPVATTTSGCDGTFSVAHLPSGTYFVQESPPAGFVATGPATLAYDTIAVAPGSQNGGFKFDNAPVGDWGAIDTSTVTYTVDGTCTVSGLRGNLSQGDTVQVKFNVKEAGQTITLVSYTAPGSSFDANTASQQSIFQASTLTNASPGWHTLTVVVPNSYYQVDFVLGAAIDHFGPAGSNLFYSAQQRLVDADNGGSQGYASSSLSGYVYVDADNDGVKDPGEAGIAGVTIYLTGYDIHGNYVSLSTTTDSKGLYKFSNLNASRSTGYKITEIQPGGYSDGRDTIGSLGGTAGNDTETTLFVNTDSNGVNYNFGEKKRYF